MDEQEKAELRKLVARDRARRRGPYESGLRQRLMSYLKARWESGVSLKQLSREVGVNEHTVQLWKSRWGERGEVKRALRRVEVVPEEEPSNVSSQRRLTVRGPAGTRVEGLSVEEVAELWRRLS